MPGKAAWTKLPIPDHIITRFEELEDAEGQPIMNDKVHETLTAHKMEILKTRMAV